MNEIHVLADTISRKQMTYTCPVCRTKYNKDGSPSKRSKPVIHRHGSCGDLSNRVTDRTHHSYHPHHCHELVWIHITDDTDRILQ